MKLSGSDLDAIRRDGIVLKERFFSKEDIARIRDVVLRLRPVSMPHKVPSRRWLLPSPSYAFRKCFCGAIKTDLVFLSEVAQSLGLRDFSAQYFGTNVTLDHIMSIESPRSDEAITRWHTDANSAENALKPADRFTLKFFIYMNDITAENGAFSYVKGTHALVTALREAQYDGRLPFHLTGPVPSIREALEAPGAKDIVRAKCGQKAIDEFYAAAEKLDDGRRNADEYYLNGSAGTVLIFDDRGLHRGGIPKAGERSILRYNYIPTKYWATQFSAPKYAINLALRAFLPGPIAAHW